MSGNLKIIPYCLKKYTGNYVELKFKGDKKKLSRKFCNGFAEISIRRKFSDSS